MKIFFYLWIFFEINFKNLFNPNAPSTINITSISDLYLGLPIPTAGIMITGIKLIKVKI